MEIEKKNKKAFNFLYFCFFAIGVLSGILIALFFIKSNKEIIEVEKPVVKVQTELITKTDTIYRTITKPKYITETIIRTDTIKADTVLPITQREYIASINTDTVSGEIYAKISGYKAEIDTLSYNLCIPTKTITNTVETQITKYKQKHWNWGITAGCGFGIITKRADLFIGIGVLYSF